MWSGRRHHSMMGGNQLGSLTPPTAIWKSTEMQESVASHLEFDLVWCAHLYSIRTWVETSRHGYNPITCWVLILCTRHEGGISTSDERITGFTVQVRPRIKERNVGSASCKKTGIQKQSKATNEISLNRNVFMIPVNLWQGVGTEIAKGF